MRLETTRRCYRVDRRQIGYFKFILEAYDNVAVVTTLDSRQAVIQVAVAPGCEAVVDSIVKGLTGEIDVMPVEEASLAGLSDKKSEPAAG